MLKLSSAIDNVRIDIDTYKKCIEHQMTPEMNWSNKEIDHVRRILHLMYLQTKN